MTATATPWTIAKHSGGNGQEQDLNSGAGWFMRLSAGYLFETFPEPEEVEAEFRDNIAIIVRAVNCHADLLAALKLFIEELDDPCRRMPLCEWDAYAHAWKQNPNSHTVHLSLRLERVARAAIELAEKSS